MFIYKITLCVFYGIVSIFQTLNSRYLFKELLFQFYSTVFLLQRLAILLLQRHQGSTLLSFNTLLKIIPYAFLMSSINLLSSYCVTIMPLAAFMALKKFVVFFVLVISLVLNQRSSFKAVHMVLIGGVMIGGLMVGERDLLKGESKGYIFSLVYTLLQAMTLQYSAYLYTRYGVGPQELMAANSLLSLPYYIGFLLYQNQPMRIVHHLTTSTSPYLIQVIALAVVLAIASQYTSNAITMTISPFEKASISNIKDMLLTLLSILYYKDFTLTLISTLGIIVCLTSSLFLSFTLIEKSEQEEEKYQIQTGEYLNN